MACGRCRSCLLLASYFLCWLAKGKVVLLFAFSIFFFNILILSILRDYIIEIMENKVDDNEEDDVLGNQAERYNKNISLHGLDAEMGGPEF